MSRLEDAYERYIRARAEYGDIILEHAPVFNRYFAIVREMNEANEAVRSQLRTAPYDRIGDFKRTSTRKTHVDVETLLYVAPHAAQLPGLIETKQSVNKAALDDYLATGQLDAHAIQSAFLDDGEDVRVYGPKVIKGIEE